MPARVPLPVVCALLEDGTGRVLVAQRPAHKHLGLAWEFPGGKVEPNEEPAAAIARELHEELGCAVELTGTLPRVRHDYGTVFIELIPFIVRLAPGSPAPQPVEHAALRWVRTDELPAIALAPADRLVAAQYAKHALSPRQ